jgi:hypothetical protein
MIQMFSLQDYRVVYEVSYYVCLLFFCLIVVICYVHVSDTYCLLCFINFQLQLYCIAWT